MSQRADVIRLIPSRGGSKLALVRTFVGPKIVVEVLQDIHRRSRNAGGVLVFGGLRYLRTVAAGVHASFRADLDDSRIPVLAEDDRPIASHEGIKRSSVLCTARSETTWAELDDAIGSGANPTYSGFGAMANFSSPAEVLARLS